jgi:hypothetical protein
MGQMGWKLGLADEKRLLYALRCGWTSWNPFNIAFFQSKDQST